MKIAFIRYPEYYYENNSIIRGGSEIANQYLIDYLKSVEGVEVNEYSPETPERLDLISIPAVGTPLVFQDLLKRIDEINKNDILIRTNWFGFIIPTNIYILFK